MPAVLHNDVGQAVRNVCYCDSTFLVTWWS